MSLFLIAMLNILGFLGILCFFGWITKGLLSLLYNHWATLKSWQQFVFATTGLFALFCMLTVLEQASKHILH